MGVGSRTRSRSGGGLETKQGVAYFDEIVVSDLDLPHRIGVDQHGLVSVLDLWDWWYEQTKLPMPLGINAIKRDVPEATQREFLAAMRLSVQYALEHVEEAMAHAMKYARGADKELVKKFALMYVNNYTYEMPENVVKAHDKLYRMADKKGFFEQPPLDILFL